MFLTWCTEGGGGEDVDFHARVAAAFASWEAAAPCAGWSHTDAETCGSVDLHLVYGDERDTIADGIPYLVTEDWGGTTRVVFNDMPFSSDAEVAAGTCADALNLDLLLRHLIGDELGLGHTCDEGEPCSGAEAEAVQYWNASTCDDRVQNEADAALVRGLYGPVFAAAAPASVGGVPFEVCGALTSAVDDLTGLATITWDFGDGGTAEGLTACHTYTEEGRYEVVATVALSEACGGETERVDYTYVSACEAPHADGALLQAVPFGETAIDATSRVDTSVPGCVETYAWEVTGADGVPLDTADGTAPLLMVPGPGTYTVSLVASGPGGVAEDAVEVVVPAGCGCGTVGGPFGWALAGVLVGVTRRGGSGTAARPRGRRRRRSA